MSKEQLAQTTKDIKSLLGQKFVNNLDVPAKFSELLSILRINNLLNTLYTLYSFVNNKPPHR